MTGSGSCNKLHSMYTAEDPDSHSCSTRSDVDPALLLQSDRSVGNGQMAVLAKRKLYSLLVRSTDLRTKLSPLPPRYACLYLKLFRAKSGVGFGPDRPSLDQR